MGDEWGVLIGWCGFDEIYRVVFGEFIVVIGVLNFGKSEWIDVLICNLNRNKKWMFGFCFMENKVCEYVRKLLEKYIYWLFFDVLYVRFNLCMSKEDLENGK